jgi:hypothetical protein
MEMEVICMLLMRYSVNFMNAGQLLINKACLEPPNP